MTSWKSENRKHKVRSDAKYDTKTSAIVIRLLAAGFTFEDAGYAIGVRETTIQSWVQRYPVFKKQIEKVKEAVKAITYAQLLRAAWGYDYDEIKEEYELGVDKDGNEEVMEEKDDKGIRFKKVTTVHKHQPPNGDLLKFVLLNRDKDNWRDVKSIDVKATNITPELAGKAEAAAIDEIAGGLVRQIESTEVKREIDDKGGDTRTVSSDSTKTDDAKLGVSQEPAQGVGTG